ncbi:MAG: prepilin peptidase [Defluviitaleaceae bacterium]|nr:prepilin peptidase [Defluviitaleaceae bacterium]
MPIIVWLVYAFIIGLLFGSFANVVIYRLPRGMSIVAPPSACTACGKRLLAFDLIPVASWLALGGRCRYCAVKVSVRYPLVELACGVLFTCMVFYTPSLSAVPLAFLAFLLVCVSMIDIDTREIPNGLLIAGAIAGVAWVTSAQFVPKLFPLAPSWYEALIGAALGAVLIPLISIQRIGLAFNKKPLAVFMENSFGYAILAATIGLFVGWQLMIFVFFLSLYLFAMAVLPFVIKKKRTDMPFSPFLSVSALIAVWFGRQILHIFGIG